MINPEVKSKIESLFNEGKGYLHTGLTMSSMPIFDKHNAKAMFIKGYNLQLEAIKLFEEAVPDKSADLEKALLMQVASFSAMEGELYEEGKEILLKILALNVYPPNLQESVQRQLETTEELIQGIKELEELKKKSKHLKYASSNSN